MNIKTIAGTIRSNVALPTGIQLLMSGRSAIDSVEETIKIVEDNLNDWTVGTGGIPNLLGEVELDASIMDGRTLKAGAVAAIKKYKNPISIARKVMEETPHVLLVGEGADLFAKVIGFKEANLLTQNARELHHDFLEEKGIIERNYDTKKTLRLKKREYRAFKKLVRNKDLMSWYTRYVNTAHGTVNIIAKDKNGDICSGVSTSGLSFKFPGRAGDSPIIGAGNYADNRYGAAACVGVGELAIRLSLARIAVYEMSKGVTIEEAGINAITSLDNLKKEKGKLSILLMDKEGKVFSATNRKNFYFWVATSENPKPEKRKCYYIEV